MRWEVIGVLGAACVLGAASGSGAADGSAGVDATVRTKGLIETFKSVRKAEQGATLTSDDRTANRAAFAALDGYFDYQRLVDDPMAPHVAQLDAAQLQRYRQLFRELIRTVAYPDAGGFFRDAVWTLREKPRGGGRVDVQMAAHVPRKDLDTNVTFHWEPRDGGPLLLVDVSFDGDSIVADYRNQFGRILKKEGPAGLLSRLEKRLTDERARYGADP